MSSTPVAGLANEPEQEGHPPHVRIGLNLGYLAAWSTPADHLALAQEADQLGFSVVWAAEAYGSDAPSMLAWIAGQTQRIDVGAAVMQIPARTPAMTAMTAATIDAVTGGRFRLGLGVSGPQVSEGWHGVPFAHPLERTREYVQIVRQALAREPVEFHGEHFDLPLPGGAGKPIRLTVHPTREHIPIYLAAIGPKNLRLAGEIADGWLAIFFAPENSLEAREAIAAGRAKAGKTMDGFDIVPTVPFVIGDDVEGAAALVRHYAALYIGGMGSREQNFYHRLATRMGYGEAADRVQNLYLARDRVAAAEAVPVDFIDRTSLLGPVDRVADRMRSYAEAGVTTLSVALFVGSVEDGVRTLRAAADALDRSGVGE